MLFSAAIVLGADGAIAGQRFSNRNGVSPLRAASTTPSGQSVAVFNEDFAKFTSGSETEPSSDPVPTDWYGRFDESKVGLYGWGGNGVYEAGGCAFVAEGKALWTPGIDMTNAISNRVVLSFRARLGVKAESGELSVQLGYGSPTKFPALKDEWQDYRLEISGVNSGIDLTFSANCDWLIDDVTVTKTVAYVASPEGLSFSSYTSTGFKAIWQPVDGAVHYLVNVYTIDDALENLSEVITGIKTSETFCDITGLPDSDDLFCFTVTAVDAKGNSSQPSYPLLVEALATPQTYDATDVSDSGFKVAWEAVAGAIGYDFYVYRRTIADADGRLALVDTDFNFVSADMSSEEESVSFDHFPGWVINVPMFGDGAIGMDGVKAPVATNMFASMESPAYNLSTGDGSVEITLVAKGSGTAKMTVSLYTMKNGVYPVYPESYFIVDGLQENEYQSRTFTLTGGGDNSVIYIETADWGQVWISDMKIMQSVNAGEAVAAPVVNYVTIDNCAEVTGIDLTDGAQYYYTLRAMGISRDEEYYISSDFTSPHYIDASLAGIADGVVGAESVEVIGRSLSIVNPRGLDVTVCNAAGVVLYSGCSSATVEVGAKGLYIVRIGSRAFKLVI